MNWLSTLFIPLKFFIVSADVEIPAAKIILKK